MVNHAKRQEQEHAKRIGGIRRERSGARDGSLDVHDELFAWDDKLVSSRSSFTITSKLWEKISHQARIHGKLPGFNLCIYGIRDELAVVRAVDIESLIRDSQELRRLQERYDFSDE